MLLRSPIPSLVAALVVAGCVPAMAMAGPPQDKTVAACSKASPRAQRVLAERNKHCVIPEPTLGSAYSGSANEVTILGTNLDAAAAIELVDDQGASMGVAQNPSHPDSDEAPQPGDATYVEVVEWNTDRVTLAKRTTGGYGAWGTVTVTLIRITGSDPSQPRSFAAPDAFASFTVERPAGPLFVRRAYAPAPAQLIIEGDGLLDLNWLQARRGSMSHIGDSWTTRGVDASQQQRAFKNYLGSPKVVLLAHPYLSGASVDNVLLGTFAGLPGGTQPFLLQPPVYVP